MFERFLSPRRLAVGTTSAVLLVCMNGCASSAVSVPPVAASAAAQGLEITGPVDRDDTGVPAGTALESSGGLRLTIPGMTVENKDVQGCVDVLADDVTIRNTRIRCDDPDRERVIDVAEGVEGLTIERSEIDGGGQVEVGIGWSRYTLRHVNIHGVGDGARFGYDVVVENSWIHDMVRLGSLHPDAVQTTSGQRVVIRGNVLDPSRPDSRREGGRDPQNAAVMMGSELGAQKVRDVLIEHNRLGGGNYTVNARADIDADGVVIRDNVFVDNARYGAVLLPRTMTLGEGNVMDEGGEVDTVRAD